MHVVWMLCIVAGLAASEQRQFRTGVTLIPIEVRAVNADGHPVFDLTAEDFEIRDAGELQPIANFERVAVDAPDGGDRGRTFFIVLGVGRLNYPTKAVDALIDFVRHHLLPNDRVGVSAYLRVIEPTIDKADVLRFLEAFRTHNDAISGWMARDWERITFPLPKHLSNTTVRALDRLWSDANVPSALLSGAGGTSLNRHSDFSYLRQSLEYLQTLTSEKHTIVVSDSILGRAFDSPLDNYWFLAAVSAKTTLSHIHSGGVSNDAMFQGRLAKDPGFNVIDPASIRDESIVTGQTGGIAAFYRFAREPLEELELITRHYYILGYHPSVVTQTGSYRRIEVSVRRPGVRLLYRQAYTADPAPVDHRTYRTLVVHSRLEQAAKYVLDPPRLPIAAAPIRWSMRLDRPRWEAAATAGGRMHVSLAFEPHPSWMTYVREGDRYVSDSEILLLADDASRNVIARRRLRIRTELTEQEFRQARRKWFAHDVSIDVATPPSWLRAVMYDFESDRSAGAEVRFRAR